VRFGTSELDDRVRKILVDTLYAQPSSLAIGAITGIMASWVTAHAAQEPIITALAFIISIIAIARTLMAYFLPHLKGVDSRKLETCYELGAFSYALFLGLMAAMAVQLKVPPEVQMLMATNAIGYAGAIAARNAGRLLIAIGQVVLSLGPLSYVALKEATPPFLALAFSIFALASASTMIAVKVFHTLRNSISAAETSARLAERMRVLAHSDVVTGLLNRAGLNHHLVKQVGSIGPDRILALFWLDLDKFKEVNDTLGHQLGDKLLVEVSNRMRAIAPADATVARFGGDEFIVAAEVVSRSEAEALASRIMAEVIRPMRIEGNLLEVTTSMGIALLPDDADDVDGLLQGADLALYQSKVNGRKQVTFFDPMMTRNLVRRREIESELRAALQRNELSIFFQPIIDLETGRIRAFEALVRWFHPEKGELRPDEFIPVAEESGAIITLGNWITAQAAKAAATWPEDVTIAVNLSPLQIRAPGAALGILNAVREAQLDPKRLELEITETVLLDHSRNTELFIEELGRAGVRFALDDFGTGYSSLGYLSKYPFSKIKVDRSFVSGINTGKKSDAIIRAVSGMGSTLGMEIVAEGLETLEQVNAVRAAGCTLGQGYYFSRAVPDYLAAMLLSKEREKDAPVRIGAR